MKRFVFLGSIFGTVIASLASCLAVLATLAWLVRHWHPAPWMLWAAGLGLLAAVVAVIWRWWRLPAERRFRFSLRGMLVSITLFALWLGIVGTDLLRWGREGAAVMELARHGVRVNYYDQLGTQNGSSTRARLGYSPFLKVQAVDIRSDQGLAALLEHSSDLPDLQYVDFWNAGISDAGLVGIEKLNGFPNLDKGLMISGCRITDIGLERLTGWRQLEELHLHNCSRITDAGLAHLKELPNLRELTLLQENTGTMPVTDAGLAQLADLQQLRELWLARIPVTDAGLAHVARLRRLRVLLLIGIPVTDEGIAQLQSLENVERLHLRNTQVTKEGVNALCERLPDCLVTWGDEIRFPAVCQIRRIEVWDDDPEDRLLTTITDIDRVAEIKEWLDANHARLQGILSRNRMHWKNEADGHTGACLSVRFEGRNRQMTAIRLGNGIYETTGGSYCHMGAAAEKQIRVLLDIDQADWTTR